MQKIFFHIDLSTPLGKRNYAMVRLLWDNALRRAEVCGLDRLWRKRSYRADFYPAQARLMLKGKGQLDPTFRSSGRPENNYEAGSLTR